MICFESENRMISAAFTARGGRKFALDMPEHPRCRRGGGCGRRVSAFSLYGEYGVLLPRRGNPDRDYFRCNRRVGVAVGISIFLATMIPKGRMAPARKFLACVRGRQ